MCLSQNIHYLDNGDISFIQIVTFVMTKLIASAYLWQMKNKSVIHLWCIIKQSYDCSLLIGKEHKLDGLDWLKIATYMVAWHQDSPQSPICEPYISKINTYHVCEVQINFTNIYYSFTRNLITLLPRRHDRLTNEKKCKREWMRFVIARRGIK